MSTAETSRQAYQVTYVRQGDNDRWRATTERREGLEDSQLKKFISYGTARWAGEGPEDEKFAIVNVLVECHPLVHNPDALIDPGIWQAMREDARRLADESFKERHPGAVVEHVDED